MSEKNIMDPLKDITSSFQSVKKLINCASVDVAEIRRYQDLEKRIKRNYADTIAYTKDRRSSFQSVKKQLENPFRLPKFTTNSDLVRLTGVSKNTRMTEISKGIGDILNASQTSLISKGIGDILNTARIIENSPLADIADIYKQYTEINRITNLVRDMTAKSILPTLPSINFPNVIIPRPVDNSIFPFGPEERRTPPTNIDSNTITDEVNEQRIPLEERHVPSPQPTPIEISQRVLIVGGFADDTNQIVARFIEQLGFEAIILSEQPNGGRTKFGKLEAYTNVDFAIILLTPDDIGKAKDTTNELKPRPSQDTIIELTCLYMQLPSEKIFTLYTEEIELSSYLKGWIHVPMCSSGGWKLKLVREMQFAGLSVDKNKLL